MRLGKQMDRVLGVCLSDMRIVCFAGRVMRGSGRCVADGGWRNLGYRPICSSSGSREGEQRNSVRVDGCFAGRVEEPRLVSTPVAFQPVLAVEVHGRDEALDFRSIQRTMSTTKQTEGGMLMPWYTALHDAPSLLRTQEGDLQSDHDFQLQMARILAGIAISKSS